MTDRPTIVATSGSQADDSKTRLALQRASRAVEEAGAETELIDTRTMGLPTSDSADREAGDAPRLREAVRAADALLLGTPMYTDRTLRPRRPHRVTVESRTSKGRRSARWPSPVVVPLSGARTPAFGLSRSRGMTIPHQVVVPNSPGQFENGQFREEALEKRVAESGGTQSNMPACSNTQN